MVRSASAKKLINASRISNAVSTDTKLTPSGHDNETGPLTKVTSNPFSMADLANSNPIFPLEGLDR